MTDNKMIDISNDDMLSAELRAEVPQAAADYWARIDERLADAAAAPDSVNEAQPTDIGLVTRGRSTSDTHSTRSVRWHRTWPAIAAAAALILVVVLVGTRVFLNDGETVDAGFASEQEQTDANLDSLPGPTQNVSTWHAVYGLWDCSVNGGAGDWVAPFQSVEDNVGIHSHGDGLISIHPFGEESAGTQATFSHFTDSMNITVDADAITLDDGRILAAGTTCGGEPAVIQMLRWQDARALEIDPTLPPRVITDDFGAERFYNDLEVWTIALAPLDTEIPLPPQERFDELALWWFPPEETGGLNVPTPDPTDGAQMRPPHDTFTNVWISEQGAAADDPISEILGSIDAVRAARESIPDRSSAPTQLVPGSGTRWTAVSRDTRVVAHLLTHEGRVDDADPDGPTWRCETVAPADGSPSFSQACVPSSAAPNEAIQLSYDFRFEPPLRSAIALWNAGPEAAWLVVETETGQRALSPVVDGVSYVAWPEAYGKWTNIEVLDLGLDIVWAENCRLPVQTFCSRE